jgi:hypothetical protein
MATEASPRVGFGDEIWRLGREGDAAGLHRAADLLARGSEDAEADYDVHRARAFALAVEGRGEEALTTLNEGWTEEWPFPSAYATDVARARFLAREYGEALTALQLGVRGVERHLDDSVAELTLETVRKAPGCWWRALKVATAGGTARQRVALALAVVGARLARNP